MTFPCCSIIKHNTSLGILHTHVDAIKESKGKYIVSLDPDDELVCGLLNELYSYLSVNEYDIIEFHERNNRAAPICNNKTNVIILNCDQIFKKNGLDLCGKEV